MRFLLPMALLGALSLVVPVAIHLLSRERPTDQRVPSLRFLEATALVPRRRARLEDALLLALRMAILAAAVLALARPTGPDAAEQDLRPLSASEAATDAPMVPVTIDVVGVVGALRAQHIPVIAALVREPAIAYALRLGAVDTARRLPGTPVITDVDGRVRLSAWGDDSDTLRLATHLAADAPARRLIALVVSTSDRGRLGATLAPDSLPVRVRAARSVDDDQAPLARIVWGIVLVLLGAEWALRRRIVRTPSATS